MSTQSQPSSASVNPRTGSDAASGPILTSGADVASGSAAASDSGAASGSGADVASGSAAARPGLVLAVLSTAAFMGSLDVFIVNVAFADIGHDFHGESLSNLSWILNGYTILFAALLVPLGRLADRYGRKEGFLAGLALFTLASALCAAAPSLWALVAFRGLQAVGAAALTPTSLGLLLNATAPERRQRAVRIWASTGALASAAGPVLGGLLVEASWRWVFIVNVPVGIIALVMAARFVAESKDPSVERTPDLLGSALLAVAIGSLALGLVKGSAWGWFSIATVAAFAVAVVGVAGFWLRSGRHPLPVVEPALLRVRAFAWSNVTAVLFMVAFGGGLLGVILWLQDVWGYSALRTGLAVCPGPLMVPIFAAVSQRMAHRVPAGRIAAAGCAMFGIGDLLIVLSLQATPAYATVILPGWICAGIGVGLALPTILSAATADLPPNRASTGSAVVNMSRQIGLVLGVSLLVAVLGAPVGYAAAHAAFTHAFWIIIGASFLAALAALGMSAPSRSVPVLAAANGG